MYNVYEVDYHGRTYLVGKADTLEEAKRLGRKALRNSGHEFPVFIDRDGVETVANMR